ncbi:MAG: hypothetical protein UT24_C0021G0009 [Candidatus Woesebacteria bacterium GW2011_GWB1_39_12]|uniref:LamG-like jellyroll fold domain-containing protein n=1 Tax=Candidatus Woesebacteria bacterium GW2011_GWB1_39_12 TaxID=1618574 RepID=A0A0G0MHR8_9BACT|nr:MAG: hypothetical protein UT24_C0021G0009 [Candidatus Woesebacteria bacterium GW2011_GWB1_39_12]
MEVEYVFVVVKMKWKMKKIIILMIMLLIAENVFAFNETSVVYEIIIPSIADLTNVVFKVDYTPISNVSLNTGVNFRNRIYYPYVKFLVNQSILPFFNEKTFNISYTLGFNKPYWHTDVGDYYVIKDSKYIFKPTFRCFNSHGSINGIVVNRDESENLTLTVNYNLSSLAFLNENITCEDPILPAGVVFYDEFADIAQWTTASTTWSSDGVQAIGEDCDAGPGGTNLTTGNIDLTDCAAGSALVQWSDIDTQGIESTDCLKFSNSSDGGVTWSPMGTAFCDDSNSEVGRSHTLTNGASYTSNFRWRFVCQGVSSVEKVRVLRFNVTCTDAKPPRINASLDITSPFQQQRVNMTANVTDGVGLSYCQFIDNQSLANGAKTFFNQSLTNTHNQCSQNYTIRLGPGSVINFTVIVNDTSGIKNFSQQLVVTQLLELSPFMDTNNFDFGNGNPSNMVIRGYGNNSNLTSTNFSGSFGSRIFDSSNTNTKWSNITWGVGIPYGEELPSGGKNTSFGLMDGNVLLFHFNNDSSVGENNSFVYDYSGMGNNGTISNANLTTDSYFGRMAARFENGTIIVQNTTSLNDLAQLSISAWVLFNSSVQKQTMRIVSKQDSLTRNGWRLQIDFSLQQSRMDFIATYDATDTSISYTALYLDSVFSEQRILNDTWNHIAVSWDGTDTARGMVIYFNGDNSTQYHSSSAGNRQPDTNATLLISNTQLGERPMNGSIDEVAIWNRSLSKDEIWDLYIRGVSRLNLTARICSDPICSNVIETRNLTNNGTFGRNLNMGFTQNARYFQYNFTYSNNASTSRNTSEITYRSYWNTTVDIGNVTIQFENDSGEVAAPDITISLKFPLNFSNFVFNDSNTSITLNSTINSTSNSALDIFVYGANDTTLLNQGNSSLLFKTTTSNTNGPYNISYNWTSPVTQPNDKTLLLLHFDNISEFNESNQTFHDFSAKRINANCSGFTCPQQNFTNSKFGGAVRFNSSSQLNVTSQQLLELGNIVKNFTITTWIRIAGNTSPACGFTTFISWENAAGDSSQFYSLQGRNHVIGYNRFPPSSGPAETSVINISNDKDWHFIAMNLRDDENIINFWVDGRNETVTYTETYSGGAWTAVSLGRRAIAGGCSLNGTLDDFAIWNSSLSNDDVMNLYRLKNQSDWFWKVNATNPSDLTSAENKTYQFNISAPTTIVTPPATTCDCPTSGNWIIDDGSICELTTTCNIGANALRITNGRLRIQGNGRLDATHCFVCNPPTCGLYISSISKLHCRP